jgi:hypothetical protein
MIFEQQYKTANNLGDQNCNEFSLDICKVVWKHNGSAVSIMSPRGGVSVETEKEGRQLMSRLSLVHAIATDAGNYTCEPDLVSPANVSVYVVEGQNCDN